MGEYERQVVDNLNSIYRIISKLEKRLAKLEDKYENLSKSDNTPNPQYYSLSDIQNEEPNKRKNLEESLNKASELAILHFRKVPPKRRFT